MNFELSEDQALLAEQSRSLFAARSGSDRLRVLIDAGAEWDEPLWREISQLGFVGAGLGEQYGGLGMSQLDLGVIGQEMGRANVSLPFFSSMVLGAGAIELAGTEAQKSRWLPLLARGEAIATFAYAEGKRGWAGPLQTGYRNSAITGNKTPVADAGVATLAIVLVDHGERQALCIVELDQPGVTRTRLDSFDQLRAHYSIAFENAQAELLDGPGASDACERLFDRAAVQAAFEAVGGAEACLTMARDYALDRKIFARPLASYQAIKHKLADVLVRVELARSSAYFAAWAAGHAPDQLPVAASSARLSAIAAFELAARENIQVHGGIGYTYDAHCHFYYRRERTLALSLGGREPWADRLITQLRRTQQEMV